MLVVGKISVTVWIVGSVIAVSYSIPTDTTLTPQGKQLSYHYGVFFPIFEYDVFPF